MGDVRTDRPWSFYYDRTDSVTEQGGKPTVSTTHYGPHIRNDFRVGGQNLRYRQQIAAFENAATSLSGARFSQSSQPSDGKTVIWDAAKQKEVTYSSAGAFALQGDAIMAVPFLSSTSADTQALQALYRNTRKTYQQTTAGVTAGEWRETWRMMRSAAKGVRKAVDDYVRKARDHKKRADREWIIKERSRRGWDTPQAQQSRKAKSVSRAAAEKARAERREAHERAVNQRISDLWLTFSFGVKPLLADVRNLAEAFARMSTENYRTRVYGNGEVGNLYADVTERSVANTYIHYQRNRRCVRTATVRYVAGYEEESYSSWTAKAMDVFGFNPEEFVPTVYNLIPYSWLVDYFTNVGDILAAVFTQTKNLRWIVKTSRQSNIYTSTVKPDPDYMKQVLGPLLRGYSGPEEVEVQTAVQVQRIPVAVGSLATPSLQVQFIPADDLRWLNIVGLGNSRRA